MVVIVDILGLFVFLKKANAISPLLLIQKYQKKSLKVRHPMIVIHDLNTREYIGE